MHSVNCFLTKFILSFIYQKYLNPILISNIITKILIKFTLNQFFSQNDVHNFKRSYLAI